MPNYPIWYITVQLLPPSHARAGDIEAVEDIIAGNAGELKWESHATIYWAKGSFDNAQDWNAAARAMIEESKNYGIHIEMMWWKEMVIRQDEGNWAQEGREQPYTPELPMVDFEEE